MEQLHSHNEKCNCHCHSQEHLNDHSKDHCDKEMIESFFFEVADCAWREVLKEKIKEYILATQNTQMTELAKIVAEGNNQRWKIKMEKKQGCASFREKLCQFFGQSKK